jgi:hypothetical protein
MSAFFLYSQENRSRVKEENPEASFGDIVSHSALVVPGGLLRGASDLFGMIGCSDLFWYGVCVYWDRDATYFESDGCAICELYLQRGRVPRYIFSFAMHHDISKGSKKHERARESAAEVIFVLRTFLRFFVPQLFSQ